MPNPKAAIQQSSFIGGEWGPLAYGLSDDPHYTTAMTLCLNSYAYEEGCWGKRSGTQFLCPTYGGNYANLLTFNGSETCSFAMEFTSAAGAANGMLRLLTQSSLVCTNDAQTVTAITTGQIELSGNPSWSVGDEVWFVFPPSVTTANQLEVRNQICTITGFTAGTNALMSVAGFFTGPVTVASPNLVGATVLHIKHITTPYTGGPSQIQTLRAVQAEVDSIILCPDVAPQQLQITTEGTASADPVFTFGPLTMVDGPYLDPADVSLGLSGLSGSITLTAGGSIFASTDVGRAVRIFTQPAVYNPASTYSTGDYTTDSSGDWWVAITSVPAGVAPGTAATINGVATVVWGPAPTAGSWAWGLITAYTSATQVSFTFDTTIPGMVLNSFNGDSAYEWQLGVYSATTGYPTCGIYYEGRLVLAGCVPNRFDMTASNGVSQIIGTNSATFSPTDPNGNVIDSSGIGLTLNSVGINQIQWMIGDAQGIIMGTLSGETLVAASVLGDPITPTSIQAHEITRYGSLNIEAQRAGMAVLFAQKYGRRVMEYLDDAFSSKWSGRHLNKYSKHLTSSGIARLAYQEEPIPTVWALMNNGLLAGCSYRRFSRFVQADPEVEGWHRHMHGAGRLFTSMCVVPGKDGLYDRLFTVTGLPPTNTPVNEYFIEVMMPPYDPSSQNLFQAWMLDQSGGPGPGNSGYDCGGGNPSAVFPSGFYQGSDSTTAAAPSLLQEFQGITLGQSPPAGGLLMLPKATFFPGTVILHGLPGYPSTASPADQNAISMSFWVGKGDFPTQSGALLSSPDLTYAESQTGTNITTSFFGPPQTGGNNVNAVSAYDGPNAVEGHNGAYADATVSGSGSNQWIHIMLSAKTTGTGGVVDILLMANDTVVINTTALGTLATALKLLPFADQLDKQKENGLALWSIGGAYVQNPKYNIDVEVTPGPPQTYTYPSLVNLLGNPASIGLGSIFGGGGLNEYEAIYGAPPVYGAGGVVANINYAHTVNIQTFVETISGDGGPSNVPPVTGLGQATGYIGNMAELWILPGTYVDWTNSTNRYKFHEFDSITESWGPIPLGLTGTAPGLGTPWAYLSGPPKTFPLNNTTGKYLTELDVTSGLINFNTGLGGGLQQSQLSFP